MKTDIKDKNKNNKETHPHSRMQETELIVKLVVQIVHSTLFMGRKNNDIRIIA